LNGRISSKKTHAQCHKLPPNMQLRCKGFDLGYCRTRVEVSISQSVGIRGGAKWVTHPFPS